MSLFDADLPAVVCPFCTPITTRRAPSYPANVWECEVSRGRNYTCFIPIDPQVQGKAIDVVLLGLKECAGDELSAELWLTAYPSPYTSRSVVIARPRLPKSN